MQSSDQTLLDTTRPNISMRKPAPLNLQNTDGTFLKPDSLLELSAREINNRMRCRKHCRCYKKFILLLPFLPKFLIQYLLSRYSLHKLSQFFKAQNLPPSIYRNDNALEKLIPRPLHRVSRSELKTNRDLKLLSLSVSDPL